MQDNILDELLEENNSDNSKKYALIFLLLILVKSINELLFSIIFSVFSFDSINAFMLYTNVFAELAIMGLIIYGVVLTKKKAFIIPVCAIATFRILGTLAMYIML